MAGPKMNTALPDENAQKMRGNTRWMSRDPRRNSVLPFQWRIQHSSRWLMQVVASELSLLAFILLVFMVFSKKWLYPSGSRFFQRCPVNVTNRIYNSVYAMSMGLLYTCKSWSCFSKGSGKDSFSLWTNHPIFVVAMISFFLALGLGLILTIWLHLPYLPHLRKLPYFGLIGTIVSFCEVTFIFFTLLLFPINLWIFELKRNISVPIGWSYFLGWLVFILYATCGVLCYLNHKNFWSLILSRPSGPVFCCSSFGTVQEFSSRTECKVSSHTSPTQEVILDPQQQDTHLPPVSVHSSHSPKTVG